MSESVYIVLVARACPGQFGTQMISGYDYIRHHLPLAQGNAHIHTARVLDGSVMVWPDLRLSKRGRWWLKIKEILRSRRKQ